MALHTHINNLSGGEVSPLLSSRTDSPAYRSGCKTLKNMIPLVQGGARRRPGIEMLGIIGQSARLLGFNFSTTTSFVIEFTPNVARFWSNGALIPKLDASGPLQITTPFDATNLSRMQACQLNDVIYLADGIHSPQVLERYGDQDWRIRDIHQPKNGYADISGNYTIAAGQADLLRWVVPARTFISMEFLLSYLIANPPTATVINSPPPAGTGYTYPGVAQKVTAFFTPPGTGDYEFRAYAVDTYARIRFNSTAGASTVGVATIVEAFINNGTSTNASSSFTLTNGFSYFIEFILESWEAPHTGAFEYRKNGGAWTAITAAMLQKATPPATPTENELIEGWPAMLDTNYEDITITPSDTKGQITLTATADIFQSAHKNSYWQIAHYRDTARTTLNVGAAFGTIGTGIESTPIRIVGTWDVFTYGRWTGSLLLKRRALNSTVWETIRSWQSSQYERNVAASGTESVECELRFAIGSTITDGNAAGGLTFFVLEAADTRITGLVKITGYTNARSVSAYVVRSLGAKTATKAWAEGAWSDVRGYPNAVSFYEQRLLFGGTTSNPQRIHGSTIGDFEHFLRGTYDDSALDFTLAAADGNPVQWMAAQQGLIVGTTGDEWLIDSGSAEKPITPTNVRVKRQSRYGSGAGLPALIVGEVALFVQRGARKVREFTYAFERDGWVAPDLTLLAEHITKTGIKGIAYQGIPESRLWCVLNDGTLVGMVYERDQKVIAWHRHAALFPQDLNNPNNDASSGNLALFQSVASIYGTDLDEVWFCVQSPMDRLFYICRLHPSTASGNAPLKYNDFFHTGTLTYSGAPTSAVCSTSLGNTGIVTSTTGLVVGQTVAGTGIPVGATIAAVNSIGFTLSDPASATSAPTVVLTFGAATVNFPAFAGCPCPWMVQPMPLPLDLQDGTNRGRMQRVARVSVEVIDSTGVNYTDDPNDLSIPTDYGPPIQNDGTVSSAPFTGDIDFVCEARHRRRTTFALSGEGAGQVNISSIVAKWETYGD